MIINVDTKALREIANRLEAQQAELVDTRQELREFKDALFELVAAHLESGKDHHIPQNVKLLLEAEK